MTLLFFLSVICMTASGSIGAVLFKKALSSIDGQPILHLLKCPLFYIGGCCYAIGLLINIILLRFFDYTLVYPSSALTYVWTLLISAIILKEKIRPVKILAIGCIVIGIVVMSL